MPQTYEKKAETRNGIGRLFLTVVSFLMEFSLIVLIVFRLSNVAEWIAIVSRILAAVLVLGIFSMYRTASMKMPWIILIMIMPVLGATLYLMIGLDGATARMRRSFRKIDSQLLPVLPDDTKVREAFRAYDPALSGIAEYLKRRAGYPMYRNSEVTYFDTAEKALGCMLEELAKAQEFIFMEYHAIEDAESFQRILEVLERKAADGVEVRLFYDDIGSIGFLGRDFVHRMEALKIRCRVFNPTSVLLNFFLNNRDHRKITVIDNRVAFTGGYNIANEYFNITHPYGHWKDTGILVRGEAVSSFTVTFLEMWNAIREDDIDDKNFGRFLSDVIPVTAAEGFVQPYADSPINREQIGEDVYISIAEAACDYVWFITPYLIITDEMNHAFGLAAKRGVDVRIITPGIPDKKIVYSLSRSYYHNLVRQGVRIFEYTPGFSHAKMCIADDRIASCGTINLDYRSLYHHFENGCLFAGCQAVEDVRRDFLDTFEKCEEVTERYLSGRSRTMRLTQLLLRLIAPLL